jgi:hypothetical protein
MRGHCPESGHWTLCMALSDQQAFNVTAGSQGRDLRATPAHGWCPRRVASRAPPSAGPPHWQGTPPEPHAVPGRTRPGPGCPPRTTNQKPLTKGGAMPKTGLVAWVFLDRPQHEGYHPVATRRAGGLRPARPPNRRRHHHGRSPGHHPGSTDGVDRPRRDPPARTAVATAAVSGAGAVPRNTPHGLDHLDAPSQPHHCTVPSGLSSCCGRPLHGCHSSASRTSA